MDSLFAAPAKLTKEAEPAGACPMADGRAPGQAGFPKIVAG